MEWLISQYPQILQGRTHRTSLSGLWWGQQQDGHPVKIGTSHLHRHLPKSVQLCSPHPMPAWYTPTKFSFFSLNRWFPEASFLFISSWAGLPRVVTTRWKEWFFRPPSKGRLLKGLWQDLCLGLGPLGFVVLRTLYRLCSTGNWLSPNPHHTVLCWVYTCMLHCPWGFLMHPLSFLRKPLCLIPFQQQSLWPSHSLPGPDSKLVPPHPSSLCPFPICNVTDLWNQQVVWGLFSSREIIRHRVGPCTLES